MTLLVLTLLAAEPAPPPPPAPEPEKIEAKAPQVIPPIPPPDVSLEAQKDDESLGFTLVRTLVVLGLVVMLAYVSLNWGLRKALGIKTPAIGGSVVEVVQRVTLDQRHALFVVKAANEYLLVGGADSAIGLISKLDAAEVEKLRAEKPAALQLSPFLQKLLSRKGAK